MLKNGQSKITSVLGVLTLLVLFAGQILPYSETCFDLEITEVVDFDDSEKDLDPDEKKEKIKAHELKLRSALKTASVTKSIFQQGMPVSPSLDILIPPPEQV